ncbi:hypothetical protein OG478_36330 [Streptomyces phaeochromogenes]|uniref:hypothetical protein n=1 Tax=Streptomyces phaeochromogenes TaxID=1923 RepID=UPI003869B199|nr:hypothetical protein OG478_36330 [Streptomyces phaeochromogenes]
MSEEPEGREALLARAFMYGGALAAGVALVLSGKTTPLEASAFVSPFLMYLQKGGNALPARTGNRRQAPRK